jgi:nucleoside-diphosphate-sugar epimerase
MKLLITGASGFIGKYLINYLNSRNYFSESLAIRYKKNQEIAINTDVVVHLAGKAHDVKRHKNSKDYDESNYLLTKQVFDAFLNSNASIFVFMSSVKAVADSTKGIITEETIPRPKSYYGVSKLKAEHYIFSREIPNGKRVYILRPCVVHGEGNKGNLSLLNQFFSKGFPWVLGAYNNKRSFLSIDNLCFAILELIVNNNCPSGIYNVADDEPISTNELIKLLGQGLKKETIIWNVPTFIIKFLAILGDVLHLPINSERLQKLTENYVVSNEKLVNAIGKKLPIGSREGLIKTFKSFNVNDH